MAENVTNSYSIRVTKRLSMSHCSEKELHCRQAAREWPYGAPYVNGERGSLCKTNNTNVLAAI